MTQEWKNDSPRSAVPYPGRIVMTSTYDESTVRTEGHGRDEILVTYQIADHLARVGIPELESMVVAGTSDACVIRTISNPGNRPRVPLESGLVDGGVPDSNRVILTAADHLFAPSPKAYT